MSDICFLNNDLKLLNHLLRKFVSQVCLSKGLGAPVGSIIVGSQGFINKVIKKNFPDRMKTAFFFPAKALVSCIMPSVL